MATSKGGGGGRIVSSTDDRGTSSTGGGEAGGISANEVSRRCAGYVAGIIIEDRPGGTVDLAEDGDDGDGFDIDSM